MTLSNNERQRKYRQAHLAECRARDAERRRLNKVHRKLYDKVRYLKQPWYANAFTARYIKHMPPWADRGKILEIYKEAYEKGLEVDHIHPRNGDGFCGLHVHYNLQVMSKADNLRKGNQLPMELP